MVRRFPFGASVALACFVLFSGCGADVVPHTEVRVDVGGHSLQVIRAGAGETTIVFEAGLGNGVDGWLADPRVFNAVAAHHAVIAYSRAGYGASDLSDQPRTLERLSGELAVVLASESRVVLVGHSLGGAIIRQYAIDHPTQVVGLVFVDATHEGFQSRTQEEEDDLVATVRDAGAEGAAREAEQLIELLASLGNLPALPDVPVRVLTALRDLREAGLNEAGLDTWVSTHASLGEGVSDFEQTVLSESGHFIQFDRPDVVIDAVLDIAP